MAKDLTISEIVTEAHGTAVDKGWWPESAPTNVAEKIALMHSELSEALEAYRSNRMEPSVGPCGKPEGVASELADVIIRIADFCGHYRVDLSAAIAEKMEYNKTRPYRHGGKVC